MREAVAVKLVGDERAEHDEARGIGPQFLLQQAVDQNDFHDAVAEQVESEKIVLRDREVLAEPANGSPPNRRVSLSSPAMTRSIQPRIVAGAGR